MFRRLFLQHPASVGESYGEHFVQASRFAGAMAFGALVCLVHAFAPWLFQRTASRVIANLHDRMVVNRDRRRVTA